MSGEFINEPMLDMYLFETFQNIDELEKCILKTEKDKCYNQDAINEIFRNMHTIKGSSAMMMFNTISTPAHSIEDMFYFLREKKPQNVDCSALSDLVLEGIDFIKQELEVIKSGEIPKGDSSDLISNIKALLSILKEQDISANNVETIAPPMPKTQNYYIAPHKTAINIVLKSYKVTLFFQEDCEMENIRAFSIIHSLKELTDEVYHLPAELIDNDTSTTFIRENGLQIFLSIDKSIDEVEEILSQILFIRDIKVELLKNDEIINQFKKPPQIVVEQGEIKIPDFNKNIEKEHDKDSMQSISQSSIISVNVAKLDKLMDLVGEMVISEAMVIQNPDLNGLEIENFHKASRMLHKIHNEVRDMVMSIRMVPLSITFQKMHRIVRDMSKKLDREVQLVLIGEETEIDKNIIEHISDPLSDIAVASNEQATGISQINQGIMQVSAVVQANSATSEESAAASEELSGQAEILKEQIMKFKLRKQRFSSYKNMDSMDPSMMKMIEQMIEKKKYQEPSGSYSTASNSNVKSISLSDIEFGKY